MVDLGPTTMQQQPSSPTFFGETEIFTVAQINVFSSVLLFLASILVEAGRGGGAR